MSHVSQRPAHRLGCGIPSLGAPMSEVPTIPTLYQLLLTAFGGAVLALLAQGVWLRLQRVITARALAVAFWEELSAVAFGTAGPAQGNVPQIGGFSSQTFDTLFGDMARTLPHQLVRDLMRYHWRMKLLVALQAGTPVALAFNAQFVAEAQQLRTDLLRHLQRYGSRWTLSLMLW